MEQKESQISLVEALIKLLRDLNVGKVIIAESAFGNCCKNTNVKFDIKIKGCPPYPFDLKNALENIL